MMGRGFTEWAENVFFLQTMKGDFKNEKVQFFFRACIMLDPMEEVV